MRLVYEFLLIVGFLLYLPSALWRRRLPHPGWSMRLGRYPERVTSALRGRPSVWVHAVSVGEVLAVRPLVRALAQQHSGEPLVLSTITPGGFEVASKQLGDCAVPVYFPLDVQACVARAIETLRPRALLLVESELWPAVIRLAHARGVPIAVVNGRVSPRTFRRSRLVKPWLHAMLGRVDRFLMQSEEDAARIIELGAPRDRVQAVGSLKWDASLEAHPGPELLQQLAGRLGLNGRQAVIVAGSTHRGEEVLLLEAFRTLRAAHPQARLILAPRHLERLAEVEELAQRVGMTPVRLSGQVPGEWAVGLVDTFGQLPRYYGLASVVFIGGSLIPHGGQNPLEASSLGKPVVFGPSMHNFEAIAHELLAHRVACQVASGRELATLLDQLIANAPDAQAMGRRAEELVQRHRGATQRTLDALPPLFTR
ncbi:MAG: 3-deoxy-D-manno-octulosonic acid transferase [Candidatus Omnitrophica bacterium]|nr:3-deoxy-D-manno-octulosonic acid transferase [Candidatus Omnitrophota bacterium]